MAQKSYECRIGLIRENDGSYSAYAINLPGVASQGETESEAIANIIDALTGAISEHLVSGQIPWEGDHIEEQMVEERRVFIGWKL